MQRMLNAIAPVGGVTLVALLMGCASAMADSAEAMFAVTLVPPVHGSVQVHPAATRDGQYAAGTVVTVSAQPEAGYAIDSTWYSVPGQFGQMYHERIGNDFKVTIDQDKRIGASFIEASAVKDYVLRQDIEYAKPGVKALKYDVYSPRQSHNLPIIVIIHGGGWSANDQKIMRQLARELIKGGQFVVASVDYRWLGTADGDAAPNSMADIIADVFGGLAHIQEHAAEYGGDPARIGVTGDSAGGHLSAVASLMTEMIGAGGFGQTPGVFQYLPSYLPKGKSADDVRASLMTAIKASAPSYGIFSAERLGPFIRDAAADESWRQAIAPLNHIPAASSRSVPQFLLRGSEDPLIRDEDVKQFLDALVKAGQRADYTQVGGASHAFFDWKPDEATKATFGKFGVYYAAEMREFFVSTLYPK